jgi:UDP-4-amino-4,6-dideoxy-N-acetyl-beta-L-altrosamine N-acetyltransferase
MASERILGRFRDMATADLEMTLRWRNHQLVRANMYSRHLIAAEEHSAWWQRVQHDATKRYFIHEHGGRSCGVVAFTDIDFDSRNASWAFYADPEGARGNGGRMEILALDFAFLGLNLYKLYCEVLSCNPRVIAMHKKFGFEEEGVFRAHHRYDDGSMLDVYRLAIFSADWPRRRADMIARFE